MASQARLRRIEASIYRELATLLHQAKDPRFQQMLVQAVSASADLSYATVLVSSTNLELSEKVGEADKTISESIDALNKAAGFFRSQLAKTSQLRSVPKLRFVYDKTFLEGDRLVSLIDSVQKKETE